MIRGSAAVCGGPGDRGLARGLLLDARDLCPDWRIEKVGDRYRAEDLKFEPGSVGADSSSSLKVTIPSACTSGSHGASVSSSGDYTVTLHVTTSAGAYTISARNQHQILAA